MHELVPLVLLFSQALLALTPLLVAGLGETIAQRAGQLGIGIEGLMLTGCITGFATAATWGDPWLAVALAMLVAGLLAALGGALTVYARCDQLVIGLAINLLALGGSGAWWGLLQARDLTEIEPIAGFSRGWTGSGALESLPIIGLLLFDQYGLTIIAVLAAALLAWLLARTRAGLVIDAVGESPDAAAAAGIAVQRWRFGAVVMAGMLAGLAGAFLSIMRTHAFVPHMTGGLGFVVLALVMAGRWRIGGLCAACLAFGLVEAIQQRLQSQPWAGAWPHQLFQALPYLIAVIALAGLRRGSNGPSHLGKPWPT